MICCAGLGEQCREVPLEVPTYYSIAETDWVPRLYDRWRAWAILGARFYEILASFVRRLYECERFGASFSSCPPSKYAAPSKYCKLLGGVVSGALSPGRFRVTLSPVGGWRIYFSGQVQEISLLEKNLFGALC